MDLIVAYTDKTLKIGNRNNLLYRIPDDMENFKNLTIYDVVVMGRKTYMSLPKDVRPLKDRLNIVFTKNKKKYRDIENKVYFVSNMKEFNAMVKKLNIFNNTIHIIGGNQIYEMFYHFCDTIYLTKIFENDKTKNCDTVFFKDIETDENLKLYSKTKILNYKSKKRILKYQFLVFKRNIKK